MAKNPELLINFEVRQVKSQYVKHNFPSSAYPTFFSINKLTNIFIGTVNQIVAKVMAQLTLDVSSECMLNHVGNMGTGVSSR